MFDKLLFNKLIIAAEADTGIVSHTSLPLEMGLSSARSTINKLTSIKTAKTFSLKSEAFTQDISVVHAGEEVYLATLSCNVDNIRKFVTGDWEKKISEFVHKQVLQRILG